MATIKVINKTGNPADTNIYIADKLVPKSHLLDVDVRVQPNEIVTARVELRVDEINLIAELLQ